MKKPALFSCPSTMGDTSTFDSFQNSSSFRMLAAAIAIAALSGCVVAPVGTVPATYVAPANVAYVAPTYAMPAPGYVWGYHARYGWGWRHPAYGWHRGWR